MSSDLQSIVAAILENNYVSLAVLISVAYDYILVFPKEIEYIWNKPWSWVSTMYLLVRYCGLFNVAYVTLMGTSFVFDPNMYVLDSSPSSHIWDASDPSDILTYSEHWTYMLFIGAADFVMILRVWVLYSRSRLILGLLLIMLFIEMITVVVAAAVYTIRKQDSESFFTFQVLEYSICTEQTQMPIWSIVTDILQMAFGGVLCMLAVAQFVRQSLQMYRVTKQWELSLYINLLVKQGILYFVGILLLNLLNLLSIIGYVPSSGPGWQFILAGIFEFVPAYTLTPRFIISMREVYAHNVQGKREGRIDSGFGLSTFSNRDAAGGPMVFAAGAQSLSEVAESVGVDGVQNETTGEIELVLREVGSVQPV